MSAQTNPTNPAYTAETAHTTGAHTTDPTATGTATGTTTAGTTHVHSGGSSAGASMGNMIKQGATQIHGLGEAIRGNINSAIDGAVGEKEGVARNNAVAARGVDEVKDGQYRGHGEGFGGKRVEH